MTKTNFQIHFDRYLVSSSWMLCSMIDRASVEMIYLCFTMTTLRYSKDTHNLNKIYSQPGTVLYHKSKVRSSVSPLQT